MDALRILSSAVALSIVAGLIKTRRSEPRKFGFVSRDRSDHSSA
jgi:hypothetical protein